MALTEVMPKFWDHVGFNLAMVPTEVLPKFRDHVGLNLAMDLTEVLPKFRVLAGLSLIGALAEMLPKFQVDPEISDDKVEEENEGEGVRTEGAGRSDKTARGGASRQGTHAQK